MYILCYADDLVIISETGEGVHTMLNIVEQWCSKLSIAVNTKMTQILRFRAASMPRLQFGLPFTFRNESNIISERYK